MPYTYKLLGICPDKLSADWARQRISLLNLADIVKKLVFSDSRNKARTYLDKFHYPQDGIGKISECMAERIKDNGGDILLESEVNEVLVSGKKVKSIIYRNNDVFRKETCDYLISTIPITDFVKAIEPNPPLEIIELTNLIKYRAVIFIHLVLSRGVTTKNNWIYFPSSDFIFTRISEPKNFSGKMVKKDFGSLTVEVCCDIGDELYRLSEESLVEKVLECLEKTSLLKKKDVVQYFVSRAPSAYPIYDIGYKARLSKILNYLKDFNNLLSAGRQGLFCYCNMDSAIEMGFSAAENILKRK